MRTESILGRIMAAGVPVGAVAGLVSALVFNYPVYDACWTGIFVAALAAAPWYIYTGRAGKTTTVFPFDAAPLLYRYGITLLGVDANGYAHYRLPRGFSIVAGAPDGFPDNPHLTPTATLYCRCTDPHPLLCVCKSNASGITVIVVITDLVVTFIQ